MSRKLCAMTDLYIMERSDAPCIVKIGSSQDCERRRQQLESGHTFRMVLLAVFPQAGGFEHQVHRKLGNARVLTGTGREWYRMSPSEAIQAVAGVVFAPAQKARAPSASEHAMSDKEVQNLSEVQDSTEENVEAPRKRARGPESKQKTLNVLNKIYAGATLDTMAELVIAKASKRALDKKVKRRIKAGKPVYVVQVNSDRVKSAIEEATCRLQTGPGWDELRADSS